MVTAMSRMLVPLALALAACSIPPSSGAIDVEMPDASASPLEWQPVADYLGHRCGDLDCHGDPQRNFIIYSCDGLRLPASDGGVQLLPGCLTKRTFTTASEYAATYRSLVGLEPLVIANVFANQGANADDLTMIRKARGEEAHKGGALITPGDAQDICLVSWLASATNTAACAAAVSTTP